MQSLARRIADGHKAIAAHREALAAQDGSRLPSARVLGQERAEIEGALAEARAKRTQASSHVPKSILAEVRSNSRSQR